MCLIIPFFIAILFTSPLLLYSSADKTYGTKPFPLTGGNNGRKSIPYFAYDQCKPYHSIIHDPEAPGKNFGLYFLMKNRGGHCDDGLLICYPGTLMRDHMTSELETVSNAKVARIFRVRNAKNDSLSMECAEKIGHPANISEGVQWRGIKVYTKRTNATNHLSPRELILKTSLTERNYTFEPWTRQLSLNFGTRTSLFTWVTFSNGEPFNDEFGMDVQYAEQMGQGTFLQEHVGLWLLGMDMLPWETEEHVHLHIYRSCSCTMEAWFTRPTDGDDPVEPKVATAGSTKCPMKQTDSTFELGKLEAKQLEARIVFTVLTDAEWNNITVELIHSEKGKPQTIVMNFTIGTTDDMELSFPGKQPIVTNGTLMPNGSHELRFDIFLLKHWYVIMVDSTQLGEVFLPNKMWIEAAWKNITEIRLNGQLFLLDGPHLVDFENTNNKFNSSVPLPYQKKIDGLRVNSTFIFHFQLLNETNNEMNITFLDQTTLGHAEFTIQMKEFVSLKIFYDGKWQQEDARQSQILSNTTNVFELGFNITKDFYVIFVNGKDMFPNYNNEMPYCNIESIKIIGDAILLDEPQLNVAPASVESKSAILQKLPNIVNYGDTIVFRSKELLPSGTPITVKLMHSSPKCSKKFDIIAQMEFKIFTRVEDVVFTCKHMLNVFGSRLEQGKGNYSIDLPSIVPLNLEILMAKDGFYGRIAVTGLKWTELCPYYMPKNQTRTKRPIPPWAIDHVEVTVNGTLDPINITVQPSDFNDARTFNRKDIPWRHISYTQIIENKEKTDKDEYVVVVNMALDEPFNSSQSAIYINFYNAAIDFHELYGTTVLWMELTDDYMLTMNSYFKGNWLFDRKNDSKVFNMSKARTNADVKNITVISFEIRVSNIGFQVKVNGKNEDTIKQILNYPTNALSINDIQYITIWKKKDGGEEEQKFAELDVYCRPQNRCKNVD